MQARYVAKLDLQAALDPDGSVWRSVVGETVDLMGTPVGLQPTEPIRTAWMGKAIGAVDRVEVSALHDGRMLAFRLEWSDAGEDREMGDTTEFVDAAAVLLPSVAGAGLVTMGAPGMAVNAWYWRADEEGGGRQVVAEGLGTTRPVDGEGVRSQGVWKDGRWRVVIARALGVESAEPVAQLRVGERTGFGVAIWEGSHGERAGIKAFSGDWRELVLASVPGARR
jgi:complex iron-sulfur molybdoenzyme family reductase subunit gamma